MAAKYRQISLKDTFSACQDMFMHDTPTFLQLFDEHFDLNELIPTVFSNAFYQHLGRKNLSFNLFFIRLHSPKDFSISTDSLLILFLSLCKDLRGFCDFSKVPDAPLFTRFRQNFEPYIPDVTWILTFFSLPIGG